MRILWVHLLRLGDVLMAAPALMGLRKKHPSAEIHLLINDGLPDLSGLMPFVNVWHRFPRRHLQDLSRERNKRLLEPIEDLLQFTDTLNSLRFHVAFNVTQKSPECPSLFVD